MFKKIVLYLTNWQVQLLILFVQLIVSIYSANNFFLDYNLSSNLLVGQAYQTESVITRSGSNSIEVFFKNTENSLNSVLVADGVLSLDPDKTRVAFQNFMLITDDPIVGIARYDQDGKLAVIENKARVTIGENEFFSDNPFISWSKDPYNIGKVFISNPYIARAGASKGKLIFVMAEPTYYKNLYTGTVTVRFAVDSFKNSFLSPLLVTDKDEALIVDRFGTVVSGRDDLLNQNLITYAQKNKWQGSSEFMSIFKKLLRQDETRADWIFQTPDGQKDELLALAHKINIDRTNYDRDLFLIATTKKDVIVSPLSPILSYGKIWVVISIIVGFLIGLSLLVIRSSHKHQKKFIIF